MRNFLELVVFILVSQVSVASARLSASTPTTTTDTATSVDSRWKLAMPNRTNLNLSNIGNRSLCEHLHPEDLPDECSCREPGPYSVVIECLKTFNHTYFNDTIGMKIDLDPCNKDGSRLSLDVTEKDHNIDYPITGIRAGEEKNIPIPGLAIAVPTVGHVGVDAAVLITGNPDSLTLKVGLNACAALAQNVVCASSIPGLHTILPWYVLSGTYTFGDVCNTTMTHVATPLGVTAQGVATSTQ
eukprot:Nitzschia sp. Nitz4//scaffold37_size175936//35973//36698//NITZ4_002030-RA/size175936-processed-gene-0.215-mRNA-1//-1//CDS//3329549740//166//frame0